MWLFTKYGFYSVVAARNAEDNSIIPGSFFIRSRSKDHLIALQKRFEKHLDSEILHAGYTDYPYRIVVDKGVLTGIAISLTQEIDYHNFKAEAEKRGDKDYVEALHRVWAAVWDQFEGPKVLSYRDGKQMMDE